MRKKRAVVMMVIGLLLAGGGTILMLRPAAPWEPSGTLVVAVRQVPHPSSPPLFALGIDNVVLAQRDRDVRASLRTRRVAFERDDAGITLLLEARVPTGTYAGVSFDCSGPEVRNAWEEDAPPDIVTLLASQLKLDAPFSVSESETSVILLSFETGQAVYEDEGQRVYLPVVQMETRTGANVRPADEGRISIEGGRIHTSTMFAMGWDGIMHHNVRPSGTRTPIAPEPPEAAVTEATISDPADGAADATTTPATGEGDRTSTTSDDAVDRTTGTEE